MVDLLPDLLKTSRSWRREDIHGNICHKLHDMRPGECTEYDAFSKQGLNFLSRTCLSLLARLVLLSYC